MALAFVNHLPGDQVYFETSGGKKYYGLGDIAVLIDWWRGRHIDDYSMWRDSEGFLHRDFGLPAIIVYEYKNLVAIATRWPAAPCEEDYFDVQPNTAYWFEHGEFIKCEPYASK